jgi:hypothetical protein
MRDEGLVPSSRIVAHGWCGRSLSPAVTPRDLLPTAARAQIIPAGFGERGNVRLMLSPGQKYAIKPL